MDLRAPRLRRPPRRRSRRGAGAASHPSRSSRRPGTRHPRRDARSTPSTGRRWPGRRPRSRRQVRRAADWGPVSPVPVRDNWRRGRTPSTSRCGTPCPWARRATVAVQVNGWPAFRVNAAGVERHPAHVASMDGAGFLLDGRPCRVVATADADADRLTRPARRRPAGRGGPAARAGRVCRVGRSPVPLSEADDVVDEEGTLEHPSGARVEVAPEGTLTYGAPTTVLTVRPAMDGSAGPRRRRRPRRCLRP